MKVTNIVQCIYFALSKYESLTRKELFMICFDNTDLSYSGINRALNELINAGKVIYATNDKLHSTYSKSSTWVLEDTKTIDDISKHVQCLSKAQMHSLLVNIATIAKEQNNIDILAQFN